MSLSTQLVYLPKRSSTKNIILPVRLPLNIGPGEPLLAGSDGSRSKIFDLGRVNFLWLGLGRVGSAIYDWGLNLKNLQ